MIDGHGDYPERGFTLPFEPGQRRMQIKRGIRILGIDDSPFSRGDIESNLVGVLMRMDGYVEMIEKEKIQVDGNDVNSAIEKLFFSTGSVARVIMMSGISFAGFNICDIDALYQRIRVPVISVFERGGNVERMIAAIEKHLDDPEKIRILRSLKPVEIRNKGYIIMANLSGIDPQIAQETITRNTIRGKFPEAIRLADLIGKVLGH